MQWLLLALVLLLLVVAGMQVALLVKVKKQEGRQAPPLDEVLPEGVSPQPRMLLYFYSEHCGPCRNVTPLVEELGRQHAGVIKVDVRRHMQTARQFGVMGTPSLVRVDNGTISRVHVGGISGKRLESLFID
jgi:thioredoxin 1